MSQEDEIYSLPHLDPDNVSSADISQAEFFCSYVYFTEDRESTYILNSREELDKIRSLCQNGGTFLQVMLWLCLILGVPGNTLSIATMATMPKSTGTFYILVLAVSDLCAIIIRSIDLLLNEYDVVIYSSSLCKFVYAVTDYATIYANWILVFICVERFVTVRYPLQKRFYFTMKRARLSVLALSILLIPFGIVEIVVVESDYGSCTPSYSFKEFHHNVWAHIIETFYSFLPAGLIILFVLLVVFTLRKHKKHLNSVMREDGNGESSDRGSKKENELMRRQRLEAKKAETVLTIMMFTTFIIFLIITIPVCIVIIYKLNKAEYPDPVSLARDEMLMYVTSSLTLLSHALNFYIYFISARKFRSHLFKTVFRRMACCAKPGTSEDSHSKVTELHDPEQSVS